MNEASPILDAPLTLETLGRVVKPYGGMIHGNDPHGFWDVEFPTVIKAASWVQAVPEALNWVAHLRPKMINHFNDPVVVTISKVKQS